MHDCNFCSAIPILGMKNQEAKQKIENPVHIGQVWLIYRIYIIEAGFRSNLTHEQFYLEIRFRGS